MAVLVDDVPGCSGCCPGQHLRIGCHHDAPCWVLHQGTQHTPHSHPGCLTLLRGNRYGQACVRGLQRPLQCLINQLQSWGLHCGGINGLSQLPSRGVLIPHLQAGSLTTHPPHQSRFLFRCPPMSLSLNGLSQNLFSPHLHPQPPGSYPPGQNHPGHHPQDGCSFLSPEPSQPPAASYPQPHPGQYH